MKRLWIAAGLLLILLAGTLLNAYYAQMLADRLTDRLEQAQSMAQESQWSQAHSITQRAYEEWQHNHTYLHTCMRHSDTDEILRAFHSVLQYLDLKEMDQYAAANADLMTQISLLAEMEQVSLVNVL